MNIVHKYRALNAAIFISLLAGLLLVFLHLHATTDAEAHHTQIDLASRQPMLSQRLLRTVLELSTAAPDSPTQHRWQKQLAADAGEFDQALRMLDQGYVGKDRQGRRIEVEALAGEVWVGEVLRNIRTLWADYFRLLQRLDPSSTPTANNLTLATAYATEHTDTLQGQMDELTQRIAQHNREDLQFMRLLQVSMGVLLITIGAMQVWVLRKIRHAERSERNILRDTAQQLDVQLSQAQGQLRDLMDVSPDLVWTKDAKGKYQFCNAAYLEFTGLAAGDLLGRDDLDIYEVQRSQLAYVSEAQRTALGLSSRVEVELTSPRTGEVGLYEIIRTPLRLGNGTLESVQSVARNITLRRAAEEELAASRQRLVLFEKCLENLNDAILITEIAPRSEPGSRIVYANKAFEHMTGFDAREVLGSNPRVLQGPKTDKRELARMHEAMVALRCERIEVLNYARDGREFWVEIAVAPVADGSNADRYTHWVAVERDVTERKHNEQKLEQLVEQATEASRLKSSFLATVSHEIRTPMNGVIGMSQLLAETHLNQEQQEFVSMIRQSADALMVIINDILDFSKIESGHLRINSQRFDLDPVLDACMALMTPLADQKHLSLRLTKAPDIPAQLDCDAARLRQILLNLIGNALKFTHRGGVELMLCRTSTNLGTDALRFEVRDSGIGIAPDQQSRLFQPFQQVDGSHTRSYGGTGLGLAISRLLVECMQGHIGCESTPGVGSVFWFELPLVGAASSA